MKAATGIGIAIAAIGVLGGALMEGTSPVALFNIPAIIIIFAGTSGVTLASVGMERMKQVPALYKKVMSAEPPDFAANVGVLVGFAEKARREGLLALEDDVNAVEDDFTRKGLQLVVDGTDPELVREILEAEMDGMSTRHAAGAGPFEQAGGFAPTMGIIGTVMGLVHVLENLDKPEVLGPAISGAFIATLFGVGAANIVFLPVANRLKAMSKEEGELRFMTLEGILSIQAGANPRVVADKLTSFVPPDQRDALGEGGSSAGSADSAQKAA